MPNLKVTNFDNTQAILEVDQFTFKSVTFTAAKKVYPALTILAVNTTGDKFVPFVKGASDSTGVAVAVLNEEHDFTAGDHGIRIAQKAKVLASKLVIDADGDDSNVDAAIIASLNANGITAVVAHDISVLDNQ